jgi:hypothetical protein
MQQPGSSMRSDETKSDGMRSPWQDPVPALQDECNRLQLLVGELVLKNHELRSQVMRLRDEKLNSAAEL